MHHARASANLWKLPLIRGLFWTHFISSVLVPFYRDWGGLSFAQILFVNGWFMLWNFLLEVPTGTVADTFGRKVSLILGCFVGVVAAVVYTSAPSLSRFLLAEVIFACSFTLISGADDALFYDSLVAAGQSSQAQRRIARFGAAQLVGIVVGALLGGVIASHFGLRAPLLFETVPMALAGCVGFGLSEIAGEQGARRPGYGEVLTTGLRTFFTHRTLRVIALDSILVGSLAWLIIWFYQALLEQAGVPLVWFGSVHVAMTLGQVLVLANVDRLEGLLGTRRRLAAAGPLVMGVCYLALACVTKLPWVPIAIVGLASFGLSRRMLFIAYLNPHIPSQRRATVLSAVAMLRTLTIAVVNPIAGLVADRSMPALLAGAGAASLVLALLSPLRNEHIDADRKQARGATSDS